MSLMPTNFFPNANNVIHFLYLIGFKKIRSKKETRYSCRIKMIMLGDEKTKLIFAFNE